MHIRGASGVLPASPTSRAKILRIGKSRLLQAWTKLVRAMQTSMAAVSQGRQGAVLCAVCWGQRQVIPSWGANGTSSLLNPQHTLLPLTCSWTQEPRSSCCSCTTSMPNLSSFSLPAGVESGAASGAGTTGPKLTPVSTGLCEMEHEGPDLPQT